MKTRMSINGHLVFVDDVLVAVQLPEYTPEPWVVQSLSFFNWHVIGGVQKKTQWRYDPRFAAVFPPVGRRSTYSIPLMKSLGRQKMVTIDRRTGMMTNETPWQSILVPTGRFDTFHAANSYNTIVLVSDDGQLYALISIESRQVAGSPLRQEVDSAMISNTDYFWKHVMRSCQGDYLGVYVPDPQKARVTVQRLANAFALAVDTSMLPLARLEDDLAKLAKRNEGLKISVIEGMVAGINKVPDNASIRRSRFLANVADVNAVGPLVSLIRRRGEVKSEAASALSSIASKHGLPTPPTPEASYAEWSRWAGKIKDMPR